MRNFIREVTHLQSMYATWPAADSIKPLRTVGKTIHSKNTDIQANNRMVMIHHLSLFLFVVDSVPSGKNMIICPNMEAVRHMVVNIIVVGSVIKRNEPK